MGCVTIEVTSKPDADPWSDAAMHELSQQADLLKVSLVIEPPCLFLELGGELDLCTVGQVPRDAYAWRPDLDTVLVDLGELTFCDLSGLRALLTFRRIHAAQGRSVVVVRATPFVWRLMRLCGLTDRLELPRRVAAPV